MEVADCEEGVEACIGYVAAGEDTDEVPGTCVPIETDGVCATVDDCSVILPGNVCGCSCTPVAVSKAEATRWQQRAADLAQSCEEVLEFVACPEPAVSCEGGACSAVAG